MDLVKLGVAYCILGAFALLTGKDISPTTLAEAGIVLMALGLTWDIFTAVLEERKP